MTCPSCGSDAPEAAGFCTTCGTALLPEDSTGGPQPGGIGTASAGPLARTTDPIEVVPSSEPVESAPTRPPPPLTARSLTLVKEMVGSERAAWIDSVWGPDEGMRQ